MKLSRTAMAITVGLFTSGAQAALTSIGEGINSPGSLYLEIWNGIDGSAGRSYVKNLGITLDQLMSNPGNYNGLIADLGTDANFGGLGLTTAAVWAVQAVNADGYISFLSLEVNGNPQSPANRTGLLTTVLDPSKLTDGPAGTYPTYVDASNNMMDHVRGMQTNGNIADSRLFQPADTGYFLENGVWDFYMRGAVAFLSSKKISDGGSMPMYFLTVSGEDYATGVIGHNRQPLGDWSFSGTQLSFSTGAAAVPVPGAVWLFGSALAGLVTLARRQLKAA